MNLEAAPIVGEGWAQRATLTLSIILGIFISCVSFVAISKLYVVYQIEYDPAALSTAVIAVAIFAPVFLLFLFADFSFGYFVGFYFAIVAAGYLWFSFFSLRSYDVETARISIVASTVVFLLPALFISSALPRAGGLSVVLFDRLLLGIFLLGVAAFVLGAAYSFKFVTPDQASNMRTGALPPIVKYIVGITSSSLLPFLFACLVSRKAFWQAGAVLMLMLCFYPVEVSKTTFFAPFWLVMMAVLSRALGARIAVVLSLLLPTFVGVLLFWLIDGNGLLSRMASIYFLNVNFRMGAVPSLAIDLYNEFFSKHELTHFCQIGILKRFFDCPYQQQLSVVMFNYFPAGGAYNASLFATEGIASVGWLYAPVAAFLCGLVIALGNRASAGLPPSLVLVSGAVLTQILLNVPLSTVLLSHGAAFLFLLWYMTPREGLQQPVKG